MSTSPSWFDQEKFSRLVKKVGPKNISEPPPAPSSSQPLPDPGAAPAPANGPAALESAPPVENLASTSRISLVSKPPSLLSEHRALPALPRRTTPLPGLKSLFQFPPAGNKPSAPEVPSSPSVEMPAVITQPLPEAPSAKRESAPSSEEAKPESKADDLLSVDDEDLAGIWQKMSLLNEELAQTIQERDHAVSDVNLLREQLQQADDVIEKAKQNATPDELALVAKERDNAVAELKALKEKPPTSDSQKIQLPDGVTKTKELVFLTTERDQARKQYADLRKQFEMLKRDQTGSLPNVREDSSKFRKELEQQVEGFRLKLEEKNREIATLKANGGGNFEGAPVGTSSGEADEKLKAEVAAMKDQLQKAKEDVSIAQRGLALSQKALQETRDTLREATEGTSLSRHNFDNLKNECAALQQQTTVLQAQNEQLSRELAAAKQRQSGRL